MTGTGLTKRTTCGEVRTSAVCSVSPDTHSFRKIIARQCHSLLCPECWHYRASELADKASSRVWSLQEIQGGAKPRHVSLSMPPKDYPSQYLPLEEILQKVKHWGQKHCRAIGQKDDLGIVHLFRIRDEFKKWANDTASRLNAEAKEGREQKRKENRYSVIMRQPNWYEMLYYAPHYHSVGYGYLEDSTAYYTRTGVIYKVHNKGKQLHTVADVARVIYYLLSHASPVDGRQIYTFMGKISYNQLICVEEIESEEIETCPECGAPRIYADTGEVVYRRIVTRVYLLKSTNQRSRRVTGQYLLSIYGCDDT